MPSLKDLRVRSGMTQVEAARYLNVSRRSYQMYELTPENVNQDKYEFYCQKFEKLFELDETHGLQTVVGIKSTVYEILKNYDVKSCYLYGSYAKGTAKEDSTIELLLDAELSKEIFNELKEELRFQLCKKISVILLKDLSTDIFRLSEILREGIKVYDNGMAISFLLKRVYNDFNFIVENTSEIEEGQFIDNDELYSSICFKFVQIGENTNKLPDTFKKSLTAISWDQLYDLRSRLIRDYSRVDSSKLFEFVKNDCVVYRKRFKTLLEVNMRGFDN